MGAAASSVRGSCALPIETRGDFVAPTPLHGGEHPIKRLAEEHDAVFEQPVRHRAERDTGAFEHDKTCTRVLDAIFKAAAELAVIAEGFERRASGVRLMSSLCCQGPSSRRGSDRQE